MEQKYRWKKRLLTLTFLFQHFKWQFLCYNVPTLFFYKIPSDRSQLTGPTCHLQIREQIVSRLFFEHCDWIEISTTSDIASQASDIQKKDRKRSNTWNRLQLFLHVSHTKKNPNKQKQKNKEKSRWDFKQFHVELLRRSDPIGNGHTGQRPWPSTHRTSTVKFKNGIEM